ncbi:MAG: hypothetical protein ACYCYM_10615 [Saccharofermentanales bacterium]
MKTRILALMIAIMMVSAVIAGCSSAAPTSSGSSSAQESAAASSEVDVVTTASIVNTAAAFENAISAQGTWIIATLNDLTIDKDLVLDGDFKNGKKDDAGADLYQRKIALYTQDADRNITARFTLTAKSLTINSVVASIQHGTFIGDLYVNVAGFQLVDAKVDGNIYFKTQEIKDSFVMDETSEVTGTQELASN